MKTTCKVAGCGQKIRARGMCSNHYNAAWARGEFGKKHEAFKAALRAKHNGVKIPKPLSSDLREEAVGTIADLAAKAFLEGQDDLAAVLRDLVNRVEKRDY